MGGPKMLGKYIFRQDSKKHFEKNPTVISHRQLFSKIYTLHSKFTHFSLYFSSFVSVSAFFHVFFQKHKKIKNSRPIIGGKGFCPHLNYWGRVPGLPP